MPLRKGANLILYSTSTVAVTLPTLVSAKNSNSVLIVLLNYFMRTVIKIVQMVVIKIENMINNGLSRDEYCGVHTSGA